MAIFAIIFSLGLSISSCILAVFISATCFALVLRDLVGDELIVMGTHHDPSLGHRLMGSTARVVTHISPLSVLVVPVKEG